MADKPEIVSIWNGAVEFELVKHSAQAESLVAAVETGLARFGRDKDALLAILRDRHDRHKKLSARGNPRRFNRNRAWRHLSSLARQYFHSEWLKERVVRPAVRKNRLRDIAKTLKEAREKLGNAMQSDIGDELFSAWYDQTNKPLAQIARNDDGSFHLVRIEDDFKNAIASLSALEMAARRAADDLQTAAGRPKGTAVFPMGYLGVLAGIYRDETGSNPGAGDGPFAKFVTAFLAALDRRIAYRSVVDAIRDARAAKVV